MARCGQELCPHWTGDGRVCMCVVLGIDGFHSKRAGWSACEDDDCAECAPRGQMGEGYDR